MPISPPSNAIRCSQLDAYEALAGIVMTRGRLAEAVRHWRTQLAMSAASESWGRYLFGVQQLAYLELRYHNASAVARALMDSALARQPVESILPGDRPYYELARFYAALGDVHRARVLLASADSNDRALGRNRPPDRSWTRGVIALAAARMALAFAMVLAGCGNYSAPSNTGMAPDSTGRPQWRLRTTAGISSRAGARERFRALATHIEAPPSQRRKIR